MDEKAFITQAQHFRQVALETGRRYGASAVDAEDVAQESVVKLWQMLGKVSDQHHAEALVARIAHNLSVDGLRHSIKFYSDEDVLKEQPSMTLMPDEALEAQEDDRWLKQQLRSLPSTEYTILRMRQVEGLTNEEIACRLGLESTSVSTLLSRARRSLLEEIRKKNGIEK